MNYISTQSLKKKRVALRQVGPGTLRCSACIWTNLSSNNKIGSNKGLKITACTASLGNLWTRYKKTKNPTSRSQLEEPGAKAGYCACLLHTVPPRGWADHPSHPLARTHPSPTLSFPVPAPLSSQGVNKEVTCFSSLLLAARVPKKPCLNLSSSLLSISIY